MSDLGLDGPKRAPRRFRLNLTENQMQSIQLSLVTGFRPGAMPFNQVDGFRAVPRLLIGTPQGARLPFWHRRINGCAFTI